MHADNDRALLQDMADGNVHQVSICTPLSACLALMCRAVSLFWMALPCSCRWILKCYNAANAKLTTVRKMPGSRAAMG